MTNLWMWLLWWGFLEGYLSIDTIDTFAKVSILYRYLFSAILPITNRNIVKNIIAFHSVGHSIDAKTLHSVSRKFQDYHQKSHLKNSKKFETIFFIQNNLPLLRYNDACNPQVVSCLRRTRIPECSLTSVPHLFGFPLSRCSGFPLSPVWVWGKRSRLREGGGERPHIRRVWRMVEDHDTILGQKKRLVFVALCDVALSCKRKKSRSRYKSVVWLSSVYLFVPKATDNSNDGLLSAWQLHDHCFYLVASWRGHHRLTDNRVRISVL